MTLVVSALSDNIQIFRPYGNRASAPFATVAIAHDCVPCGPNPLGNFPDLHLFHKKIPPWRHPTAGHRRSARMSPKIYISWKHSDFKRIVRYIWNQSRFPSSPRGMPRQWSSMYMSADIFRETGKPTTSGFPLTAYSGMPLRSNQSVASCSVSSTPPKDECSRHVQRMILCPSATSFFSGHRKCPCRRSAKPLPRMFRRNRRRL